MALEGSIKDFGLAEIFQLISLQRKTGILTVHQGDISVTINFDKGQIVYAAPSNREEAEKIGKRLINTGNVTEKNLDEAFHIHEKTGEKIGHILVSSGYISKDELKEVLQVQVKDIIFQILRWRNGWYRFDIQNSEYEKEYQVPIPTDFVLMEGIRMVDEWPYLESIISSGDIILTQCYKEDITETLFSSLSPDEVTVFNLIDGKRSAKEIIDLTQLNEFEAYKILATLQVSGLISQTSTSTKTDTLAPSNQNETKRFWTTIQIAILTFIVSFILFLFPLRELAGIDTILFSSRILNNRAAQIELLHLHRAIRYYYLEKGVFPDSLEPLYKERYLKKGCIMDPWGSLFIYEIYNPVSPSLEISSAYRLYSSGADRLAGTEDDVF